LQKLDSLTFRFRKDRKPMLTYFPAWMMRSSDTSVPMIGSFRLERTFLPFSFWKTSSLPQLPTANWEKH
jgi:hypothetical protein